MIFYVNMQTTTEITCPLCQSKNIVRNGKKARGSRITVAKTADVSL